MMNARCLRTRATHNSRAPLVRYIKSATRPAQAVFRVQPEMTKHEVKEYLTKIYNLPVQRVMTANFDGARRRDEAPRRSRAVPNRCRSVAGLASIAP